MKFGDGNLIAFSTGCGAGLYASYAGRDADGEVSVAALGARSRLGRVATPSS